MSLKAKIEAVIYASEEPVTLAQLAGLLGLEAQAEIDALDAQQGSLLALEEVASEEAGEGLDPEAMNAEALGGFADEGSADPGSADPSSADSGPAEEDPAHAGKRPFSSSETPGPETLSAEPKDLRAPATPEEDKRRIRERERRLREYFRTLLDRLTAEYAEGDRGLEIREVAGGFRFATKPEFHDTVRGFVRSLKPPLKLSLQALETLAVVAYKQPVTAPEVSEIRGVDSSGVLGSLLARKLVTTAGRKQVIGRPILYKTTKEFLLRFGLKDTSELPSIEEFERMAGELNEAVQEEIEMDNASAAPGPGPEQTVEADVSKPAPSPAFPAANELNPERPPHRVLRDSVGVMSDPGAPNDTLDGTISGGTEDDEHRAAEQEDEPMRDVHEAQADGVPEEDFQASERGEASNSQE